MDAPGSIAAARREQVEVMKAQNKLKIAHYGRLTYAKCDSCSKLTSLFDPNSFINTTTVNNNVIEEIRSCSVEPSFGYPTRVRGNTRKRAESFVLNKLATSSTFSICLIAFSVELLEKILIRMIQIHRKNRCCELEQAKCLFWLKTVSQDCVEMVNPRSSQELSVISFNLKVSRFEDGFKIDFEINRKVNVQKVKVVEDIKEKGVLA
nr:DNA glycosylase [Tanacetum cinerariifolium]